MIKLTTALVSTVLILIPAQNLVAQSNKAATTVLCRSTKTGLVVGRSKCKSGEIRVNPQDARFAGCY
jgi:hypothetical protein